MPPRSFARYTWAVLAYNLLVILWGAYVRASGSGAGCGNHWPLCNGQVIPQPERTATVIEFAHRLSSGLVLLLVIALFVWARRAVPEGHPVRRGAGFVLLFTLGEALLGAGLVLFGLVEDNASVARAVMIALHLANTFLLLASLTLTGIWATRPSVAGLWGHTGWRWALATALAGILLVGMSGAITALGDTLFPAGSFMEGVAQDVDPAAHFLLRLRVWHPVLAVATGGYLILLARLLAARGASPGLSRFASLLTGLVAVQLAAGALNVALLAPVWLQLTHLLLADLIWICLVVVAEEALVQSGRAAAASPPAARADPSAAR